jgi:hypothetical protein
MVRNPISEGIELVSWFKFSKRIWTELLKEGIVPTREFPAKVK